MSATPRLIPGLTYDEYDQLPGIRASTLKAYARSARHGWHEETRGTVETPAMRLGRAVHAAVLEPDAFRAAYTVAPKVDRRTKAGKAIWAAFQAEAEHQEILTEAEMVRCLGIRDAVRGHPTAAQILEADGHAEVSAFGEVDGRPAKCRIDWLCTLDGVTWIWDLKTTRDARPETFGRQAAQYLYHLQAAWYLDVLDAIAPVDRAAGFVAVESDPPHPVSVLEISPHEIEAGRQLYRKALRRLDAARDEGVRHGYAEGIHPLGMPDWALADVEYSVEQQLEDYDL